MYLKQERPEMDDFEKKKNSKKGFFFYGSPFIKTSQKIFAYSFVSKYSKLFIYF